jgi:hypothetical protein
MKALALGAFMLALFLQPAVSASCQLSSDDFDALRASSSHIQSQNEIDALNEKSRANLCRTRINYWKYHRNGGSGYPPGLILATPYLSPTEAKEYSGWLDEMFRKSMADPKK